MKTTTEMKLVPLDKLIPYANNARTHSPAQINKLRSSLREFGFLDLVDQYSDCDTSSIRAEMEKKKAWYKERNGNK